MVFCTFLHAFCVCLLLLCLFSTLSACGFNYGCGSMNMDWVDRPLEGRVDNNDTDYICYWKYNM